MRVTLSLVLILLLNSAIAECEWLNITYHSDPEGATLFTGDNNKLWGYTPMTLRSKVQKAFRKKGECVNMEPAMVRWPSGAEVRVSNIVACGNIGLNQQFVFVRPDGLPGREIDALFALQLQQNALLAAQVRAQQDAAFWQTYAATAALTKTRQSQLTCTSNVIGANVYTTCR